MCDGLRVSSFFEPGACFSKVPETFRARKGICETANQLVWKGDLLTRFQGNKKKNDFEIWLLKSSPFLRYKGNCDIRKWPVKFRDFRETGPRKKYQTWVTMKNALFCHKDYCYIAETSLIIIITIKTLFHHAPLRSQGAMRCRYKYICFNRMHKNNLRLLKTMFEKLHGVQGWRSGESTRLPPMWPGFDSLTRRHMSVEFVGSVLCTERFSPGNPVSPLLKNQPLTWFAFIINFSLQCPQLVLQR